MPLLVFLTFFLSPIVWADKAVTFNDLEKLNTGIETGYPIREDYVLSEKQPANVVIPNTSQHVVNVPKGGIVEKLYVAEGDEVSKGDVIATINSLELLDIQSEYLQSLSILERLTHDLNKDKMLFNEGIIPERRYRQTSAAHQQLLIRVSMLKKTLQLAGMDTKLITKLEKTGQLSSQLSIHSNDHGVVMKQFVVTGQRVNPAEPLYQIAQLSRLWLEIHAPLSVASTLTIGEQVKVCDKPIEGAIIAIGKQVHAADQGVLIRAEVTQAVEQLTPGEFVHVCFVQKAEQDLYRLPRSALFHHNGQTRVFIQTTDGFISQIVHVVNESISHVLVSGLHSPKHAVVTKGTAVVKAAWLGLGGE